MRSSLGGWDLAWVDEISPKWMRHRRVRLDRLNVAKKKSFCTVLGSIPHPPPQTVESEWRQMKQCWLKYIKKSTKNPPVKKFCHLFTYLFTYIDKLYSPQFIRRFTNVPTCLSFSYSFNEFIIYRRQLLGIGLGVLLVNICFLDVKSICFDCIILGGVFYSYELYDAHLSVFLQIQCFSSHKTYH